MWQWMWDLEWFHEWHLNNLPDFTSLNLDHEKSHDCVYQVLKLIFQNPKINGISQLDDDEAHVQRQILYKFNEIFDKRKFELPSQTNPNSEILSLFSQFLKQNNIDLTHQTLSNSQSSESINQTTNLPIDSKLHFKLGKLLNKSICFSAHLRNFQTHLANTSVPKSLFYDRFPTPFLEDDDKYDLVGVRRARQKATNFYH